MARSEPMVNRIADRLVEKLATIKDDAIAYLTAPKHVQRGLPPEGIKFPQPAMFVTVGQITPTEAMDSKWRDTAEIIVTVVTTDVIEPETELYRVVSDVRKMIRANRRLTDAAGAQLARYLREGPVGGDTAARPSGLGVTSVTAVVDYQTDADNP